MSGHILELDSNIERKKVVYKNRYGMDLVGELYHKADMDLSGRYSALIIGAPYGGVKMCIRDSFWI